jgi:hypothetical protein
MTDNVIILGAGASVDGGIPLLGNFVDTMWDLAMHEKHNNRALSDDDKKIFSEAMKVRDELDGYHGRASFNDRNIEDILSILSFNLIGGDKSDQDKLRWMIKAIARTIELTCNVKHSGQLDKIQNEGSHIYRSFWQKLFKRFGNFETSFPSIISFNYDLVLERALYQVLVGTTYHQKDPGSYSEVNEFPYDGINLKYQYNYLSDVSYTIKYVKYLDDQVISEGPFQSSLRLAHGTKLEKCSASDLRNSINIEVLKLHGSLNFPSKREDSYDSFVPTASIEEPYIIPPIINKAISPEQTMWGIGIKRLREAKNIIIVGYSLPQTDIYMQYFIKAGIGPNKNLNKIYVFNPAFDESNNENERMRDRFGNCFSPQLKNRIEFFPVNFENFVVYSMNDKDLFFT